MTIASGDSVLVRTSGGRKLLKRVVKVDGNQVFVCSEQEWEAAAKDNRVPHSVPYHELDVLEMKDRIDV